MPTGMVKKIFKEKGFGFITPDDGTADIFAPMRTLVGSEDSLREGLKVIFESEIEARTSKPKATTWSIIEGQGVDMAATAAAYAAYGLPASYGAIAGGVLGADRLSPYGMAAYSAMAGAMPVTVAANGQMLPPGWEQVTDPSSGKVYYANRATGESSWTPPANPAMGTTVDAAAAAAAAAAAVAAASSPAAADATSSASAALAAGTEPSAQAATAPAALPAGWESASDPASGKTYYFNRASGQTSWTPPPQ